MDDFWVLLDSNPKLTDQQIIEKGSLLSIEKKHPKDHVKDLLRDHSERSVLLKGGQRVRKSFDELLDFFEKIEYYLNLKLIAKDELRYFKYYLQHCAFKSEGEVLKYSVKYGFYSLLRLLFVMNIKPKDDNWCQENLKFRNLTQKHRYIKLRDMF